MVDASAQECQKHDWVIIETPKGLMTAKICGEPREVENIEPSRLDGKLLRLMGENDWDVVIRNQKKEKEAYKFCLKRIQERELPMKLVRVEYMFDGSKATFKFTADGRIDFRELVKDLAHRFRIRIEMLQIGVRDETKILGGIGSCGRELCCSTWLTDFNHISIRMAKDQNLSLNPTKVSGLCGRLMCCLVYELELYQSMKRNLPKVGKTVEFAEGTGKVTKIDIIKQIVYVEGEDGEERTFAPDALKEVDDRNRGRRKKRPQDEGPENAPKDREREPGRDQPAVVRDGPRERDRERPPRDRSREFERPQRERGRERERDGDSPSKDYAREKESDPSSSGDALPKTGDPLPKK
jgi:cell fate regulator YaaT (PSP1 superfamily)